MAGKLNKSKNNVTLVSNVGPGKDWYGDRYLQILAYQDVERTKTFPGPQIPITDVEASDAVILRGIHAMLVALTGEEEVVQPTATLTQTA